MTHMDLRPALYIVGIFLLTLSLFMCAPLIIDLFNPYGGNWRSFAFSTGITGFTGALLMLSNKQEEIEISGRSAFLLTALTWFVLCFFSAIPFWLSTYSLNFTDSLFESVSGLTTTGATILTGLDNMSKGILLWRAILQWLGGIGIIVMAVSVLPFLKVGGMQLFRLESSEKEKILPRAAQLASFIIYIYLALTFVCACFYYYAGMSPFDAIAHAMTTIATGGFSTKDSSFSSYDTYGPEIVAIIFMILGCLPFAIYIKMINDVTAIKNDEQTSAFIKILFALCTIMVIYMVSCFDILSLDIVIETIFTTTSLLTGTGFSDTNYMLWGGFAIGLLLFTSCIGGCAGSTTCGIKIFRFQILYAIVRNQILQLIHPNGVFTIQYNKQPLNIQIAASVIAYFFIFILSFVFISVALMACDLDLITSLSGAIATLANVGPGLGNIIGPTGTYAPLPDNAKWIMIFSMIFGRLEFFTLLVFLNPRFWKF